MQQRQRHRIPSIFNLSMVDVLCCALGCVILLWLLNLREVKERIEAAGLTSIEMDRLRAEIDERTRAALLLRSDLDDKSRTAARLQTDLENKARMAARLQTDLEDTTRTASRLRSDLDDKGKRLGLIEQLASATAKQLQDMRLDRDKAKTRAETAEKERDLLKKDSEAFRVRVAELDKNLLALQSQKAGVEKERELSKKEAETFRSRLAELDKSLLALQAQKSAVEETLVKKNKDLTSLGKDLTAARERSTSLDLLLKDKEALAKATAKTADDLAERLRDVEARMKLLKTQADLVPGLRDDSKSYKEKLTLTEARVLAMEKDIAGRKSDLDRATRNFQAIEGAYAKLVKEIEARNKDLSTADKNIETLQVEKKTLLELVARARTAAENRFAGIQLTGRRVVFIIDMSGSMQFVDERTPSTQKWPIVCDTVAKIMRSLNDMEKFQVVVFADSVFYPLGDENKWLDHDPKASADRVHKALSGLRPKGGTNLYAALEAAFRFRQAGMDTIYLFSDGLPNLGPGLTAQDATKTSELERGEILGKYLRRTLANDWNRKLSDAPKVRINSVGFFYESPDLGAFLWALAREHDGSFVGMSRP